MLRLEGITILSLEQAVATPFATRQLAGLGARVVKIERPGVRDFARSYGAPVKGLSSHTDTILEELRFDPETIEALQQTWQFEEG